MGDRLRMGPGTRPYRTMVSHSIGREHFRKREVVWDEQQWVSRIRGTILHGLHLKIALHDPSLIRVREAGRDTKLILPPERNTSAMHGMKTIRALQNVSWYCCYELHNFFHLFADCNIGVKLGNNNFQLCYWTSMCNIRKETHWGKWCPTQAGTLIIVMLYWKTSVCIGFTICNVSLHLFAVCNNCVQLRFNTSGVYCWMLNCNIELEQHWEIQRRTTDWSIIIVKVKGWHMSWSMCHDQLPRSK